MKTRIVLAVLLLLVGFAPLQAAEPIPVILDTDIGTDIDESFAVALALSSPELEVRGLTSVSADAWTRALILCRMLYLTDHRDIPVASGKPPRPQPDLRGQYMYGLRATPKRPVKESAVEFMYSQLKKEPGKITIITVGDLTNVAELITKHPEAKPWIKRIVLMGGAVRVGYNGKPPVQWEWNIKADIKGAQTVFTSGIPLVVAPLDATLVKLDAARRKQIFDAKTPLTYQLLAHYQLWGKETPTLFDPVAVTLAFNESFCTMEDLYLEVDDKAFTREIKGKKPNARVATAIKMDEFLDWYVKRVTAGKPAPVLPLGANPLQPVERGGLPNAVAVFEDYDTDIERRWWLSGLAETKNVPPRSKRACRGVICNDFDGKMGNHLASYSAVIFNPVPGPPMGSNTRLAFRCFLKGTDELRVQIYSLSNGYHRHGVLKGLKQGEWLDLTVDMTRLRRPDGSGGPLSDRERIDDIQFYTHPDAELLIDDVVLYDAAAKGETQPFPKRFAFTGWFDNGRRDEWPGDFDIVDKEKPLAGKAAKSVLDDKSGKPWLRVGLRGHRPIGEQTRLRLSYRLSGADTLQVIVVDPVAKTKYTVDLKDLKKDVWTTTTLDLPGTKAGSTASEIQFLIPAGATLLDDDLLLYVAGDKQ
ncbi:MAG: nucleoside hydrolase [Gemmataceae bacterium]